MSGLISDSELIVNPDGSVYHLGLKPEQLASVILTVGDPERVDQVSQHFDLITYTVQRREFRTQGGILAGHKIMCISTGIGTDNVDIVLNELDALANIDFESRRVRPQLRELSFLRIGTSGTFQADIPVDSFLVSKAAIGLDGLGPHYCFPSTSVGEAFAKTFPKLASTCYSAASSQELFDGFMNSVFQSGTTLTCAGFYGPQRRSLRIPCTGPELSDFAGFCFGESRLTNFEMETAGIYALAHALGHRALSVSAILANRATGAFSSKPRETVDDLIALAVNHLRENAKLWWPAN